ncbi:MAG: DUF1841 family protein [Sphingomonadaceae bacterium]
MFNPTQDEVRRFFCGAFRKQRANEILSPLEAMAADWITQHPEYHDLLSDEEAAVARDFAVDSGQTNPFLHLSMHLSIDEQISIDQPRGIRDAATALTLRLDSAHEAQHKIMECLGEMIWTAQRNGQPPDGDAYIASVQRLLK